MTEGEGAPSLAREIRSVADYLAVSVGKPGQLRVGYALLAIYTQALAEGKTLAEVEKVFPPAVLDAPDNVREIISLIVWNMQGRPGEGGQDPATVREAFFAVTDEQERRAACEPIIKFCEANLRQKRAEGFFIPGGGRGDL